MTLGNAIGESHMVVEGVKSAFSIKRLSEKYEIEMPICDSVLKFFMKMLTQLRK